MKKILSFLCSIGIISAIGLISVSAIPDELPEISYTEIQTTSPESLPEAEKTTVTTATPSVPTRMDGQAPLVYVPQDCALRVTVTWRDKKPSVKLISPDKNTYMFFSEANTVNISDNKAELVISPADTGQWLFQYAGGDANTDIFVEPFLLKTQISDFSVSFTEIGEEFMYDLNTNNAADKEIYYEVSVNYSGNQVVVDSGRSSTNTKISNAVNISEVVPNGQEYRVSVKVEYKLQGSVASVIATGGECKYYDENKALGTIETEEKVTEARETTAQTVEIDEDARVYSDKNNNSIFVAGLICVGAFIVGFLIVGITRARKV